jgi:putative intracellular protease/amidase
MRTRSRRALRLASSSALALLTLAGLAAAGVYVTTRQANTPTPSSITGQLPANRPTSGGSLVVAVALGTSGTIGSDAIAPYEVFASSPGFSVYTVAVTADAVPTRGGPFIVPTYTFADTATGRAPRPDVVVVPAVADPDGPQEAALRAWITDQADRGARILGVCNGSQVLAATGLLDGRTATAHWSTLGALRRQHPQVHWVEGRRFVQDGPATTTAGITSGIPGALQVMADVAGPDEATRVGRVVRYPNWSVHGDTTIPTQSFSVADLPVGLNALIPWGRPTVGVALTDGVGEIDVASTFEVYSASYAARAVPIATNAAVTTKHGMVLLANTPEDAPSLTRMAVPGSGGVPSLDPQLREWSDRHNVPVDAVQRADVRPAFDAALEYLSTQTGRMTAVSAAKMIDYPVGQLRLADRTGIRIPLLLALGLGLAACAAAAPVAARRLRESRRHLVQRPVPGGTNSRMAEDGSAAPTATPIARA